jgi:hypothetical protein
LSVEGKNHADNDFRNIYETYEKSFAILVPEYGRGQANRRKAKKFFLGKLVSCVEAMNGKVSAA